MTGRSKKAAFSLLELLAVMAIIGLLAFFTIPAFNSTLRASKLTVAGQAVMDELNLARQAAQSRNAVVEVRCYKLPDHNAPASDPPVDYRVFQSFLVSDNATNALGRPRFLPSPIIISTNASESAFLSSLSHAEQTAPTNAPVSGFGTNYRYRSMRFAPNGSVDLQNSENFITLVAKDEKPLSQGGNFFTIQINPISGSIRSFRP